MDPRFPPSIYGLHTLCLSHKPKRGKLGGNSADLKLSKRYAVQFVFEVAANSLIILTQNPLPADSFSR